MGPALVATDPEEADEFELDCPESLAGALAAGEPSSLDRCFSSAATRCSSLSMRSSRMRSRSVSGGPFSADCWAFIPLAKTRQNTNALTEDAMHTSICGLLTRRLSFPPASCSRRKSSVRTFTWDSPEADRRYIFTSRAIVNRFSHLRRSGLKPGTSAAGSPVLPPTGVMPPGPVK